MNPGFSPCSSLALQQGFLRAISAHDSRALHLTQGNSKSLSLVEVGSARPTVGFFIFKPRHTGSGGLSVANQIYDRFKAAGKPLNAGDVAIIDPADMHYYQVSLSISSFSRLSYR